MAEEQRLAAESRIVRWERAVVVRGVAWHFVVALFGIVLTLAGLAPSPVPDGLGYLLLLCSFMGTPIVAACFCRWLPLAWQEQSRLLAAVLLAAPCVLVEVLLAMIAFAVV